MRIIRKKRPKERRKFFECEHCGCWFYANNREYTPDLYIDRQSREQIIYVVNCPTCGKMCINWF